MAIMLQSFSTVTGMPVASSRASAKGMSLCTVIGDHSSERDRESVMPCTAMTMRSTGRPSSPGWLSSRRTAAAVSASRLARETVSVDRRR